MIREIVTQQNLWWGNCHTTQLVVGEIVTQQNLALGNCHTTFRLGKLSHNTTCDGEIVKQHNLSFGKLSHINLIKFDGDSSIN